MLFFENTLFLPATLTALSMIPYRFAYVPRIVHDHFHSVALELVFEFQQLEESFELLQYCLIIEVGITTDVIEAVAVRGTYSIPT